MQLSSLQAALPFPSPGSVTFCMWRMCRKAFPHSLTSRAVPSAPSLSVSWDFTKDPTEGSRLPGMPKLTHQTQSILVGPAETIASIFFQLSNPSSGARNQKILLKEALIDANGWQRFLKELNLQPELLGRTSGIIILLFIAVINNNKPKHPNGPHTSCISLAADLKHE